MSATRPPMTAGPMLRAFKAFSARASTVGPAVGAGDAVGLGFALPCDEAVPAASSVAPAIRRATVGRFLMRRGYWLARAVSTRAVAAGVRGRRRPRRLLSARWRWGVPSGGRPRRRAGARSWARAARGTIDPAEGRGRPRP